MNDNLNIKKKIGEDFYTKYYNLDIFKDSNEKFENYLNNCKLITSNVFKTTDFKISTITGILHICDFFNIKVLFERISLNENIAYIEYNNTIKGEKSYKKKIKEETNDKRKKNKGKSFANQLSIGFICKKHNHNKPICVKIFSKGSLTITGCKSKVEIYEIYDKLIYTIKKINCIYLFENQKIEIFPYKNLYKREDIYLNIETVNGSMKCLFKINLNNLKKTLMEKYSNEEIFIKNNRSALIELDLKLFKILDKRKNIYKIPKVSIYGTGSIVINSKSEEIIYNSYNFIKDFLNNNLDNIIDKDYNFN